MKALDSFKLSTKKFVLFYEFERLWLLLTAINIIAIFLIIRGSTAPLLVDNSVLEFLFCIDNTGDKTLYSIAISYFAAYIFYLIQIYYPERKKTLNALLSIRPYIHNLVLELSRFLFVWDTYKQVDANDEGVITSANIETIYFKTETGCIYKMNGRRFRNLVMRIDKTYNKIINDVTFQECDYSLRRFLLIENLDIFINRMHDLIEEAQFLDEAGDVAIRYPIVKINRIKQKIQYLSKLFDIELSTNFTITNSKKEIADFENRRKKTDDILNSNKDFYEVFNRHTEKNETVK